MRTYQLQKLTVSASTNSGLWFQTGFPPRLISILVLIDIQSLRQEGIIGVMYFTDYTGMHKACTVIYAQ